MLQGNAGLQSASPHRRNALERLEHALAAAAVKLPKVQASGVVSEVGPSHCRINGLSQLVRLGECVDLAAGDPPQLAEVIRIDESGVTIKPFDIIHRVGLGATVRRHGFISLSPDRSWLGRTINALGAPIDGGAPLMQGTNAVSADRAPPSPMRRQRISAQVRTGVRAIDLFTPICAGQRIGIFAGSGIGKSTLLSMLARSGGFDSVVIGLIGERGREVREFIEDVLQHDRARTVTVVATGDESP